MKNVKLGITIKPKKVIKEVDAKNKEVKGYNTAPVADEFFTEDLHTYVFHPSLHSLRDQILQ